MASSSAGPLAAGIAFDSSGNVYIADTDNDRVQVLDSAGTFVRKWGTTGSGDGQLNWPADIAVDAAGNVYVAEFFGSNARVQKFEPDGEFLDAWPIEGCCSGIAVYETYVYAAGPDRVVKLDAADGTQLDIVQGDGFDPGEFRQNNGVTTDADGNVWTVEWENARVQKFDSDLTPLAQFPVTSGGCGARAIDVDAAGSVWVGGCGPDTKLQQYTATGTLLAGYQCNFPIFGLAVNSGGIVYGGSDGTIARFGEGGAPCVVPSERLLFGGAEGVTISDGAQFVNDPAVELTIVPPSNATEVRISNDGGFTSVAALPIAAGGRYSWTLSSAGEERLPKTVYVRFSKPDDISAQTFTDDVILDQTAPVVSQERSLGAGAPARPWPPSDASSGCG